MDKIVILPMIIGFALGVNRSSRTLFLYYFLPILTVFPVYYEGELANGIPELSFWSAALVPVICFWILREKGEGYFFTWLDVIILLHLLLVFYGQYINSGYKPAQKVLFNDMMARFFPYVLAKAFFSDRESRIEMLKVIVVTGAVVGFFMAYEFKFWYNIFDKPIRKLWPTWVPWDLPMKRWGFKRAFGPFGHPICGGYFFAMIVPMAVWLWRGGHFQRGLWQSPPDGKTWGPRTLLIICAIPILLIPAATRDSMAMLAFVCGVTLLFMLYRGIGRPLPRLSWGLALVLLCFGGGMAAISRAPIAGIFLGFVILWFGWSRRKGVIAGVLAAVMAAAAPVVVPKIVAYVNVDRATADTPDQRNAAYRKELMENYAEVAAERPWFGYGRFDIPVVKGQESIDNEYLFMTLASGKTALYAYMLMMVYVSIRLLLFVKETRYDSPEGRLAWGFLAAWGAAIFTQSTVYAGTQTVQFFYILAGMSEALVSAPASAPAAATYPITPLTTGKTADRLTAVPGYGFVRTLTAFQGARPLDTGSTDHQRIGHEYHFSRAL
jgi:hypothetical protein